MSFDRSRFKLPPIVLTPLFLSSVRMYRIKTDIRQYKCDTKEKVEKLIRNWVIRPNDLIYQADQQRWSPIGEHPSFLDLFATLEAQERAEPDTVVTSNPLVKADVAETPADATVSSDAPENEEVTRIQVRPIGSEESPSADADGVDEMVGSLADIRDDEGNALEPAEPEAVAEQAASEKEDVETPEDIRQTEAIDLPLAPPEAPAGVEPPVRADEVTVMTERTLDLLKVTDEAAVIKAPAAAPDESASQDETLDLGSASSAAEEIAAATDTVNPLEHHKPKLGRHDLPEDFFATNELMAPVDRESLRNDLAALEVKAEPVPAPAAETWEGEPSLPAGLEDTSLPEESEDEDDDQVDVAAGDGQHDEFDEDERDEWDEYDDLDAEELAPHLSEKHSDRVADVYNIPLPFEILPDEEDLLVGIKRNNAQRTIKDKAFPYPIEKEYKKVQTHVFDFSRQPPTDRSPLLVLGILGAVVLIVVVIAMS